MYQLRSCIFYRRKLAAGYRCKHRSAECRTFLTLDHINFQVHHIRDDLLPQRALCSSAADLCTLDPNTECACHFKGISQSKCHTFKYCLRHVRTRRIHRHADERRSRIRIVVRRTLSHQIRQEINVIFAELRDLCLLLCVILRANDLIHPPFVAGRRTEHAAHEMIMAIRMCKCVERIEFVHAEFFRRDKDGAACAKRNVAHAVTDRTGADCSCSIITCSCYDLYIL